jgi:hypothetical protein
VNDVNFSKNHVTFFLLPVPILVLSKLFISMERKNHNKYLPGWQLLGYPVSEFDTNLENERSEDDEYNFYSFAGTDHQDIGKDTERRNAQRSTG